MSVGDTEGIKVGPADGYGLGKGLSVGWMDGTGDAVGNKVGAIPEGAGLGAGELVGN